MLGLYVGSADKKYQVPMFHDSTTHMAFCLLYCRHSLYIGAIAYICPLALELISKTVCQNFAKFSLVIHVADVSQSFSDDNTIY